jgi:hypothetical protein
MRIDPHKNVITARIKVKPANSCPPSPDTCGQSFSYKIVAVEPGTYKLGYELYAHDSNPDPQYHGTSANEFTVTDRANVEFDPTF